MSIRPFQALACPLDGLPLTGENTAWRCANGHSFDIAREGYTNLLPVQNKRSRDPGDSKEMVAARRRFLNAGHYLPIAEAVSRAVLADLPRDTLSACLDAGCGEGYYLRQLAAAADQESRSLALFGLDISKWAVLAAAKQDRMANWVVGSNANLPAQPGSVDRLLCLFGFPVYPEFARVLKPGGKLVQVDAGPDHLRELREILYPSLKPDRSGEKSAPDGYTYLEEEHLAYRLQLTDPSEISDLLAMTPHLYRASADGRAKASRLQAISLTVDVRLVRYRKAHSMTECA